jgi:fructose-bisphosphate aldolase class II
MHSLSQLLKQSQIRKVAIGHFNVSDFVLLKAVFSSALELDVPVMVGVSEVERQFIGTRQIAALVQSLREEFEVPIFLNADHTHSLESAVEAARCGLHAITFDRSALPLEQNIFETQNRQYVEETGVDVLAPAVGNRHGLAKTMASGMTKKRLDVALIAQIKNMVRIPLTLHGGSGTDDDDLRKAIGAGINIVHINT